MLCHGGGGGGGGEGYLIMSSNCIPSVQQNRANQWHFLPACAPEIQKVCIHVPCLDHS